MIFFIEVDHLGNIVHTTNDPMITIVPISNRISFLDENKQAKVNDSKQLLTGVGNVIQPPIEIDEPTFIKLMNEGIHNFTFDFKTDSVKAREC